MIAFHGSTVSFDELDINQSKVTTGESKGIYFSTDKKIAEAYGNIIYTLDIPNCIDFNQKPIATNYIIDMLLHASINPSDVTNVITSAVDGIMDKNIAIYKLHDELFAIIENNEYLYNKYYGREDMIYEKLKEFTDNNLFAYSYPDEINGVGIIKNTNGISIVNIEHIE